MSLSELGFMYGRGDKTRDWPTSGRLRKKVRTMHRYVLRRVRTLFVPRGCRHHAPTLSRAVESKLISTSPDPEIDKTRWDDACQT